MPFFLSPSSHYHFMLPSRRSAVGEAAGRDLALFSLCGVQTVDQPSTVAHTWATHSWTLWASRSGRRTPRPCRAPNVPPSWPLLALGSFSFLPTLLFPSCFATCVLRDAAPAAPTVARSAGAMRFLTGCAECAGRPPFPSPFLCARGSSFPLPDFYPGAVMRSRIGKPVRAIVRPSCPSLLSMPHHGLALRGPMYHPLPVLSSLLCAAACAWPAIIVNDLNQSS